MKITNITEDDRVMIAAYRAKVEIIKKVVADYFNQDVRQCERHGRHGDIVNVRRHVQYFSRYFMPSCPLKVIGYLSGNGKAFDHATVSHNCQTVETMLTLKSRDGRAVYPDYIEKISDLRHSIRSRFNFPDFGFAESSGNFMIHGEN